MLIISFLLIYAFVLSHLIGIQFLVLLQKWLRFEPNITPEIGVSNLIGLAVMSPFIAIYHFYFKIDYTLHVFFIAMVLANPNFTLLNIKNLGKYFQNNALFIMFTFIAAALSVLARPGSGDIGDYHLQAIKWAENYQNIVGLGNFNRPLANNNWWFNLQAFFGFSFLGIKSIYVGNALIFVSVLLFFLKPTIGFTSKWLILVPSVFILMSVKTAFVGGVTPDYVITSLVFVCVGLFERYFISKHSYKGLLLIIFILSCFAITVKLNAFPFAILALLSVWELIHKKFNLNILLKLILIGFVFIVPWLIGNVIVSGWLAYPVNSIDLFNVDWKVPAEVLKFERFSILQWGKNPGADIYQTAQLSFFQWLPGWFLFHDFFNRTLIVLTIISILLIAFNKQTWKNKAYRALFIFALFGFVFCMYNGPHIRYVFGYMLVLIGLMVQLLIQQIGIPYLKKEELYIKVALGLIVLLLLFLASKKENMASLIFPRNYTQVKLSATEMNGNAVIITKQNNAC